MAGTAKPRKWDQVRTMAGAGEFRGHVPIGHPRPLRRRRVLYTLSLIPHSLDPAQGPGVTSSTGRLIRITTLGRLAVTVNGEEQPALPGQRLRCGLLVHLSIVRECTRDSLLALLWPDRASESARHALSQNLYELRRTLGDGWLEARGDSLVATTALCSDVVEFEHAVESHDHAAALATYGGPFLDGVYLAPSHEFEEWVERQRSRLARLHRRARREHVDERIAAGDHRTALRIASEAVAVDPFDDEMQHQLIALLARTGDRAGALEQYARYAEALRGDGLEPLEATRQLVASIREPSAGAGIGAEAAHAPDAAPAPRHVRDAASVTLHTRDAQPATAPARDAAPATLQVREARPTRVRDAAPTPRLPPKGAIAAAAFAAVALVLWWAASVSRDGGDGGAVMAFTEERIAVLPFDYAGPPAAEYLSTQLPAALIHQLRTEIPTLPVVSHYGVLQYAGADVSPDSVARALGTSLLVGGSIMHSGDNVVVRVQLIDGATTAVLRSAEVRGAGGEPLALIAEVVGEVMLFLRSELGRELRVRAWRAGTSSDVAFDMFGRGESQRLHGLASAGSPDSPSVARGLALADSLFAAAAAADPQWPEPLLHRAQVAEHRAFYALTRRETSLPHFETALAYIEDALAVKPGHAAAYEARAAVRYRLWQTLPVDEQAARRDLLRDAEHDLQQALAADAHRASAWSLLSALYFTRGEYHLAYTAAERGYRADYYLADAFTLLDRLARAAFEMRNDATAQQRCREGQKRFPGQPPFLACDLLLGGWSSLEPLPPDSAWQLAGRLIELAPRGLAGQYRPTYHAFVAANLVRAGLPDSARAVLRRSESAPERDPQLLPVAAAVHVLLGDPDAALARLRIFITEQPMIAYQALNSRMFEPLREEPEFRRLAGLLPD
jgi:DNA-binding SARP family transcriptional activator/TolB-like protein/tetratricopeptide (TPR) repeat protein